jgi:hypothetical protein
MVIGRNGAGAEQGVGPAGFRGGEVGAMLGPAQIGGETINDRLVGAGVDRDEQVRRLNEAAFLKVHFGEITGDPGPDFDGLGSSEPADELVPVLDLTGDGDGPR